MAKEAESGMAFEYALASHLSEQLGIDIKETPYKEKSFQALQRQEASTKEPMLKAAFRAIVFLVENEPKLKMKGGYIKMQPSEANDVRDVIVENTQGDSIGFSAKHHHHAVKHSRLSDKIDFGEKWTGVPCSKEYWQSVEPTFADLRQRRKKQELWREMLKDEKHKNYYFPILKAFQKEIERICHKHATTAPKRLIKYLLGEYDFYKIIKESNKIVCIESYNLSGTLSWGKKISIPKKLIGAEIVENRFDTIQISLNSEWLIKARLHNAESKIVPSLKFDIEIISWPKKNWTTRLNLEGNN